MLQRLVSRNEDIRRLVEKGYAVAVDNNHLVVRDVPYLDANSVLCRGAIVAKVDFIDQNRVSQTDHQVFFAGGVPHGLDGKPIPNLGGGTAQVQLSGASADVVVERSFSNKPRIGGQLVGFADFFAKVESYVGIISGPAIERHQVSPLTRRSVPSDADDSVFKFPDTLTSRADLGDLTLAFEQDVVAVIGLGGTGAYVLDLLVKTPVREIRAFDADAYCVHNSFRSPGKMASEDLGRSKADVYHSRYENFRHGVSVKPLFIDGCSSNELEGATFAFVCVDQGSSRSAIFEVLLCKGIPFIDVGMGLIRHGGSLGGLVRTTYYSTEHGHALREMNLAPLVDGPDAEYGTNIQIAELNALNASLAVIRFKQVRGFYLTEVAHDHLLFGVGDLQIAGACLGKQVGNHLGEPATVAVGDEA